MKNIFVTTTMLLLLGHFGIAQTTNTWATASTGGALGYGTILKGDSTGHNFTVVHSFDFFNGAFPVGKLAVANNGVIYCVTELGGYDGSCTICTYNPVTDSFAMIYQFFVNQYAGGEPVSGLVKLPNGLLYGTTVGGGTSCDTITGVSGGGVIYNVDPATNVYTDVYNFPDSSGIGPTSELFLASDGNLYGILPANANSGYTAFLFKFDPANNVYTNLYNFGVTNQVYNHSPALVQGSDLKLYGVLAEENTFGSTPGFLFSYDLGTSAFTDLHDFTDSDGIPEGGLLAAGGNIYGETMGNTNFGQIYSYNINSRSFSTLAHFSTISGYKPIGGLGMWGNNQLTGSATQGGLYGSGTMFTFNLTTNIFATLMDFDSATTGSGPMGDLLETGFIPTGIAAANTMHEQVYPNPVSDVLYVKNARPNTTYTITNTLGQVVDQGIVNQSLLTLDLSALASGIYMFNNLRFVKQ